VSRSARSGSTGRGSSGRRPVERTTRPGRKRTVRRRRELSFVDTLLISAAIVVVAFVAVILWIVLRGIL
jgi:hypothetical protein